LDAEWAVEFLPGDLKHIHIHRIRVNGAVAVGGLQSQSLEVQANIGLRHKQDLWGVVITILHPPEANNSLVGASPCLAVGFEAVILIEDVAGQGSYSISILAMTTWWIQSQQHLPVRVCHLQD
jgi:hypothetical protein